MLKLTNDKSNPLRFESGVLQGDSKTGGLKDFIELCDWRTWLGLDLFRSRYSSMGMGTSISTLNQSEQGIAYRQQANELI